MTGRVLTSRAQLLRGIVALGVAVVGTRKTGDFNVRLSTGETGDLVIADRKDNLGQWLPAIRREPREQTGSGWTADSVALYPWLFAEIDNGSIEDQITTIEACVSEGVLPEPCLLVYSGSKSVHAYWRLVEPVDASEPEQVEAWLSALRGIAELLRGDQKIASRARLMRCPGFDRQTASGARAQLILHDAPEAKPWKLDQFPSKAKTGARPSTPATKQSPQPSNHAQPQATRTERVEIVRDPGAYRRTALDNAIESIESMRRGSFHSTTNAVALGLGKLLTAKGHFSFDRVLKRLSKARPRPDGELFDEAKHEATIAKALHDGAKQPITLVRAGTALAKKIEAQRSRLAQPYAPVFGPDVDLGPSIELVDKYLSELNIEKPITFLRAPLGSGKTEALVKRAKTSTSLIVTTHRTVLTGQLADRFEAKLVQSTDEKAEKKIDATDQRLAICSESLWRLRPGTAPGLLVIDEADAVLVQWLLGGSISRRTPENVETLRNFVKAGWKVVLASATLNAAHVKVFSELLRVEPESVDVRNVGRSHRVPVGTKASPIELAAKETEALGAIFETRQAGHSVVTGFSSRATLEATRTKIGAIGALGRYVVIFGAADTSKLGKVDDEARGFATNIESLKRLERAEMLTKLRELQRAGHVDTIFFTNAVDAGLSLEGRVGLACVVAGVGPSGLSHLSGTAVAQMLLRARNADRRLLFAINRKASARRLETLRASCDDFRSAFEILDTRRTVENARVLDGACEHLASEGFVFAKQRATVAVRVDKARARRENAARKVRAAHDVIRKVIGLDVDNARDLEIAVSLELHSRGGAMRGYHDLRDTMHRNHGALPDASNIGALLERKRRAPAKRRAEFVSRAFGKSVREVFETLRDGAELDADRVALGKVSRKRWKELCHELGRPLPAFAKDGAPYRSALLGLLGQVLCIGTTGQGKARKLAPSFDVDRLLEVLGEVKQTEHVRPKPERPLRMQALKRESRAELAFLSRSGCARPPRDYAEPAWARHFTDRGLRTLAIVNQQCPSGPVLRALTRLAKCEGDPTALIEEIKREARTAIETTFKVIGGVDD